MFDSLGNSVLQFVIGISSAAVGACTTHWLERQKQRELKDRQSKLEKEIVQVANQPEGVNHQNTWTWQQLVEILAEQVPVGRVTTYPLVSLHLYRRVLNQPVGALLRGASNNGHIALTNRVVRKDGSLADLPDDGAARQREQLEHEGVPFTHEGRVDWSRVEPVVLT